MSTKICPYCGATIPADSEFCPNCGARLTGATSAPPPPVPAAVPPPQPAQQIPPGQPMPQQPVVVQNKKEVVLAAILSFIIPGLGQIYVGNVKKGIIYIILAVVLYIIFWPLGFLFAIYAIYDAYKMAEIYNNTGQVPQDMFLF